MVRCFNAGYLFLFEAVVGRLHVNFFRVIPTGLLVRIRVETGNIWFYIENRRIVEDVQFLYFDHAVFDGNNLYRRYPDGIRPRRRPRCKKSSFLIVPIGKGQGAPWFRPVEIIDQPYSRKPVQILQCFFVGVKYDYFPFRTLGVDRLYRRSGLVPFDVQYLCMASTNAPPAPINPNKARKSRPDR